VQRRVRGTHWILIGAPDDADRARRLFDTLLAEFLTYPPTPELLRARIRNAPRVAAPALSQRASRQRVAERFSRWFSDLELPELMRALDPRLADVSVLIRGEPGTGRGVLAQYIHLFGGTAAGTFVHVPCTGETRADEILAALADTVRGDETCSALTICLEEVDRLPVCVQLRVCEWIESGLPPGVVNTPLLRWLGTTGEAGSGRVPEHALCCALSDLAIRLPPLRERPHLVGAVAGEVSRLWCESRQVRPRRFGEDALSVMEEYPWPGNLREMEAVVVQTLASATSDPVRSDDLQYDGYAFAPLGAGEVGALIIEDEPDEGPEVEAETEAPDWSALAEQAADLLVVETEHETPPVRAEAASRLPDDASASGAAPVDEVSLARLVASLSHEVRNPLATIRTFAGLLPERFNDPEFRDRFTEVVNQDVARIDALVEQLGRLSDLQAPKRETVDVSALLEELLDQREETIRERRLLVLKELDTDRGMVVADREQLRFAFEALLGKSLELVPERGDVYLASRHHEKGMAGLPSVRVLVRFHDREKTGAGAPSSGLSLAEHSLELTIAELVIRAQGGGFALTTTEGKETVIVVDLAAR